jgi:hypothetical protein
MATDFRQIRNPYPIEGLRQHMHMMLDNGFTLSDFGKMAEDNPAKLLGIG